MEVHYYSEVLLSQPLYCQISGVSALELVSMPNGGKNTSVPILLSLKCNFHVFVEKIYYSFSNSSFCHIQLPQPVHFLIVILAIWTDIFVLGSETFQVCQVRAVVSANLAQFNNLNFFTST